MQKIKMTHPELKAEIEVPASAEAIHMASGWARVEDKPKAKKASDESDDAKPAAKNTTSKES